MKYPNQGLLIDFGKLVKGRKQEEYDQVFEKLVSKHER
jgi:hypothetical protein